MAYLLAIHDKLVTETGILVQYCYMKAFKEVTEIDFKQFASRTANSIHGHKKIFHNILTMYSDMVDDLSYNHSPSQSIGIRLNDYITIAKTVLKD